MEGITMEATLQARMKNPAFVVPNAMDALQALGKAVRDTGLPLSTLHLVELRASQINGCAVCIDMHAKEARRLGETDERLFSTAAWRETPYYTSAERAALALTEAVTRLSDRSDPVPDDVWEDAADHFSEQQLGALVLAIGTINLWNRLNAATHQVPGAW
jgi:AhpD family alkylhydroperoxidase